MLTICFGFRSRNEEMDASATFDKSIRFPVWCFDSSAFVIFEICIVNRHCEFRPEYFQDFRRLCPAFSASRVPPCCAVQNSEFHDYPISAFLPPNNVALVWQYR
jgi:hypothetical protein